MPSRNCVICNSSGHNRRTCPILQRNVEQIVVDTLPDTASDLSVQQEPQEEDYYDNNGINNDINMRMQHLSVFYAVSQLFTTTMPANNKQNIKLLNELTELDNKEFDCSICYEIVNQTNNNCCKLNCGHKFCVNCITIQIKQSEQNNVNKPITCALCRKDIDTIYSLNTLYFKEYINNTNINN